MLEPFSCDAPEDTDEIPDVTADLVPDNIDPDDLLEE